MSDEVLQGGCFCGHVRYVTSALPFNVEYCHCRMCQRTAGAVVVNWMDFRREQVTWTGSEQAWYASSEHVLRGFCPVCGCSMSFKDDRHTGYITLTLASLDDPDAIEPTKHIYTESQCRWLNIVDDCERFERAAH